ncbi:hypothetical protein CRUP_011427 [Coryphaenoides rupestris]|nr:hypothetical protein CRUP_011427 [Coryphaenoides rupestris]
MVSLEDQYWKESTTEGSVITTSTIYENLWMSCASDSTGIYNCRDFPSLFALPGFALFLGFLGWLMVGIALPNRNWKVSSVDGNVITTSTIYENLWMSCATDSTGVHNCRDFPSLLALNGYIQASRALMIAAIVFGTFGLVAALAGIKCTKVGGENYALKGRIAAIGGVFFLLQGLCTMIAISWYAANITQQFFDEQYVYRPNSRGPHHSVTAASQSAPSHYGRNAYV